MSYGYVYVAQVAMGADYNQCIKAFTEAELQWSFHHHRLRSLHQPWYQGWHEQAQTEEKKCGCRRLLA